MKAIKRRRTELALRRAAFEKAWTWYVGPELTEAARAKIDAELEEGWALARKHAGKRLPSQSRRS